MKKLSNNIAVTAIVSVVASILVVGLVWAGTSALRGSSAPTEDTVPNDTTTIIDDTPSGGLLPSDASLQDVIVELNRMSQRLDTVQKQLTTIEATAQRAFDNSTEAQNSVAAVKSTVGELAADFKKVADDARTAVTRVDALDKKLINIDAEGSYTGPVRPNQFSRKLTADDLTGNWPLDRTAGELDAAKLVANFAGCWADYRYNVVVTVDAFRKLGCTRVLK